MDVDSSVEEKLRSALALRKEGVQAPIDLSGVDLSGLHLPAADLTGANFQGADLTGAILAGARLSRANLRGANLVGAALDGADLTDADLRGADLAGARIDDAVFASARLEGACLTAVQGDPLSMVEARMDRATVRLSEFTMRDVAEMVVRGAFVNEKESLSPTSLPGEQAESTVETTEVEDEQAAPRPEIALVEAAAPASERALEEAPGPPLLVNYPPSNFAAAKQAPIPSFFPPAGQASIVPTIREAEVSARQTIADQDAGEVTASKRMFQDLNALIDAARIEQTSGALSLRPQLPAVEQMRAGTSTFPNVGDDYLGAEIIEALTPGVSSRCFRAKGSDGSSLVVRVFDPGCDGAALQLPAFQRGLRALNKLQGLNHEIVRVVELIAVAADQTAYVMREYNGGTLEDLVSGSLSLQQGLVAVKSLCEVVEEIHQQGLMVRSWKPSNLFVAGNGLVIGELDMVHLTTMSQYRTDLFGYRNYAAPEEIIGAGTRSPTADVFSLGKVLEYILTREEPFIPLGGRRILEESDNIPDVLVSLVRRATAQEAGERYQSAADLAHDLSAYQSEGDKAVLVASIRPAVIAQLSVRPMSRNPDLPKPEVVIKRHKERARGPEKPEGMTRGRQIELAVALLGGLGGLALVFLLILSPTTVSKLEGMLPYISGMLALSVFWIPAPETKVVLKRAWTWAGAAAFFFLLNPLQLAELTWKSHLSKGTIEQRQVAVQNLSRLGRGDLSGSKLAGTDLSGRDLASSNFVGADLRDVNFSSAFLLEANFSGADISGATFLGANLFGARLETAVGVSDALCDRYTVLPAGYTCLRGNLASASEEDSVGEADGAPTSPSNGKKPRHSVPVVPQ